MRMIFLSLGVIFADMSKPLWLPQLYLLPMLFTKNFLNAEEHNDLLMMFCGRFFW
jgi:hypothetical protein